MPVEGGQNTFVRVYPGLLWSIIVRFVQIIAVFEKWKVYFL